MRKATHPKQRSREVVKKHVTAERQLEGLALKQVAQMLYGDKRELSIWEGSIDSMTPSDYAQADEEYRVSLMQYVQTDIGRTMAQILNEPRYTVKDTEITYRVAAHWENNGVVAATRSGEKGWRKFTMKDAILLRVLMQLRDFGLSLEQLRKVRISIEEMYLKKATSKNRGFVFEFFLAQAIATRLPIKLIVFKDGSVELLTFDQYVASLQRDSLEDHIAIALNSVLEWFFPAASLTPQYKQSIEVTAEELEILFILRTCTFESITLHKRNGKLHRIEVEEIIKGHRKLVDILNEEAYQSVEVQKRDGSIVMVRRKISKLL